MVADAVAASNNYPAPLIVIDMGTATTVSVLNDKKQYIGGMITPGVGLSLDALTSRASQLSEIEIKTPRTSDWKKYNRMYEKWYHLQQCSILRWNCRTD